MVGEDLGGFDFESEGGEIVADCREILGIRGRDFDIEVVRAGEHLADVNNATHRQRLHGELFAFVGWRAADE